MFHFPQCGHPRAIPRVAPPQPSIDRSRYPRPRVAEHGGYGPIPTPPNLRLRRSTEDSPKTEVTTPSIHPPNLHNRRTTYPSPKTEVWDLSQGLLTSIFGGTINRSPKTEDTEPLGDHQTSIIGDQRRIRRTRKLQPLPPYRLTSTIGERTNLSPNTEVRDPVPDHQTSIFGDTTNHSPNTEVTTPLSALQTSAIGEPQIRRRTRRLQPFYLTSKRPSSANHQPLAEDGRFRNYHFVQMVRSYGMIPATCGTRTLSSSWMR
ncbi:hypothetical protein CLV65_0330 [Pseudoscardovia suis]|uniref:Uncharacterized protein n=1 Tax=Pseudoscardovia suis TaxID=987063 RepID=A0A261ERM0_9BIFI|nr:hypothetical protein PSSU_1326 [Pseudoscardovia suis]PJJ69622.1 hypothetical protein CLV65_0330 [Pseudoscardovia suis]